MLDVALDEHFVEGVSLDEIYGFYRAGGVYEDGGIDSRRKLLSGAGFPLEAIWRTESTIRLLYLLSASLLGDL